MSQADSTLMILIFLDASAGLTSYTPQKLNARPNNKHQSPSTNLPPQLRRFCRCQAFESSESTGEGCSCHKRERETWTCATQKAKMEQSGTHTCVTIMSCHFPYPFPADQILMEEYRNLTLQIFCTTLLLCHDGEFAASSCYRCARPLTPR
ncbi:hypothetical protein B0T20DRAFT_206771 [Sordaria brevicollis]|uniref:Secreted protein n=1 Tax=Sordaria brevicollis TaxID=83679 RepID=A0AAE0UCF2_SORBR|nr:hypothetical protein B0T20DRAFT_206771 [Sordaria brevicollis]